MNVWIVNGFLGSGKTTFLNRFFLRDSTKRRAYILNEYGSEAIDQARLAQRSIPLYSILNGSIFCACQWDTVLECMLLFLQEEREEVVIETSGFTDPKAFGKLLHYLREQGYSLQVQVITIVDALNYGKLSQVLPLLKRQVEWADHLILSKVDLVSQEEKKRLIQGLPLEKIVDPETMDWSNFDYLLSESKKEWSHRGEQRSIAYRSCTIYPLYSSLSQLQNDLYALLGKVYRIKGNVRIGSASWRIDGVWDQLAIEPSMSLDNELVFLYDTQWIGKQEILNQVQGE